MYDNYFLILFRLTLVVSFTMLVVDVKERLNQGKPNALDLGRKTMPMQRRCCPYTDDSLA
jgi:hypothetical protein